MDTERSHNTDETEDTASDDRQTDRQSDTTEVSTTMAIVTEPDDGDIGPALQREGLTVTRVSGVLTRPALEEAGIVRASLFVLTDLEQATAIPIAKDLNHDLRTVIYARGSIPEFVRGQLDFALDPRLVDATVVAEELTR